MCRKDRLTVVAEYQARLGQVAMATVLLIKETVDSEEVMVRHIENLLQNDTRNLGRQIVRKSKCKQKI
jgi:hypothetical protein